MCQLEQPLAYLKCSAEVHHASFGMQASSAGDCHLFIAEYVPLTGHDVIAELWFHMFALLNSLPVAAVLLLAEA